MQNPERAGLCKTGLPVAMRQVAPRSAGLVYDLCLHITLTQTNWQTNSQPGPNQQKNPKLICPKNVKSQKTCQGVNPHSHSLASWLLPIPWFFYHPPQGCWFFRGKPSVSSGTKTEWSSRDDSLQRFFCVGNLIHTSSGLLLLCTVCPQYTRRSSAIKHPCTPTCHHLWPLQLWKTLILPWWELEYSN